MQLQGAAWTTRFSPLNRWLKGQRAAHADLGDMLAAAGGNGSTKSARFEL